MNIGYRGVRSGHGSLRGHGANQEYRAIEKTSVGDLTQIDEALQDASEGIGAFSEGVKLGMMGKITEARSSDVRPFLDSIENVNRLYNEPTVLLADDDAIYMLPIGDDDTVIGQSVA